MEKIDYLDKENIGYDLVYLKNQVHTVEETAHAMSCKPEQILKSLLIQDTENKIKIALIVILGIKKIDFKKINKICQFYNARFVPINEVLLKTGFNVGTLPPWGYNFQIPIYYDKDILNQNYVYAGSGNQHYLIKFNPIGLKKFENNFF